ncbi:caspase-6-like isoform X2 [Plodia interpunctella]|uniref:caspase-6-like isoform X2 n=1 Tax=Plodia interpunctella TaxID=58824 RepID=UPI0023684976|nr:caspase-6-like isoform X2 [Plodia interpunctella]
MTASPPPPPPVPPPPPAMPESSEPPFVVKKCTEPIVDEGNDIKIYPVGRARRQRVMLLYTYMHFEHDIEHTRRGADRDSDNLKLLFHELGFTCASFFDHKKEETMASLRELRSTLAGATCVFVVVSSHGYDRLGSSDNYFRCRDGQLISLYEFIEHFSNKALPKLRGVPKVFIFQTCRGNKDQDDPFAPALVRDGRALDNRRGGQDLNSNSRGGSTLDDHASAKLDNDCSQGDAVSYDGHRRVQAQPDGSSDGSQQSSRIFSDILIAHSTVPGYVSNRNPEEGSWYIQTLCRVFAAHAHHRHVEELLTLVDQQMETRYHRQTSSVDKWGFNCRLYLMPGLQE